MRKATIYISVLVKALLVSMVTLSQVSKVESIGLTVRDMNRSLSFYIGVLGFKKVSDAEYHGYQVENLYGLFGINIRVVRLQLGDEFIELTDFLTSGGRSIPVDHKSNDLYFQHIAIVVSDMDKAYHLLRKHHVEYVSTKPQTLPKSIPGAEGIKAFYFHDLDNHNLELIYFPEGKGQEKWHRNNGKLFLGIDHTAIGISNSANSHFFYNEILGLEKKGESWNKGIEQEHLNNVEGASLHISGYRATHGPGIELLEYITPGPGKPFPADSRANDLWNWQTTLIVADPEGLYRKLREMKSVFVSKDLVQLEANGFIVKNFIVRDPDGHAILIKNNRH